MDWFQSYLSERSQTFTAADSHSDPIAVNCSVPQGSVLGPIQFISYTEDVAELLVRERSALATLIFTSRVCLSVIRCHSLILSVCPQLRS